MNIALITGSCGLVGSESSLYFEKKGFKILGIDNNNRKFFLCRFNFTIISKCKVYSL